MVNKMTLKSKRLKIKPYNYTKKSGVYVSVPQHFRTYHFKQFRPAKDIVHCDLVQDIVVTDDNRVFKPFETKSGNTMFKELFALEDDTGKLLGETVKKEMSDVNMAMGIKPPEEPEKREKPSEILGGLFSVEKPAEFKENEPDKVSDISSLFGSQPKSSEEQKTDLAEQTAEGFEKLMEATEEEIEPIDITKKPSELKEKPEEKKETKQETAKEESIKIPDLDVEKLFETKTEPKTTVSAMPFSFNISDTATTSTTTVSELKKQPSNVIKSQEPKTTEPTKKETDGQTTTEVSDLKQTEEQPKTFKEKLKTKLAEEKKLIKEKLTQAKEKTAQLKKQTKEKAEILKKQAKEKAEQLKKQAQEKAELLKKQAQEKVMKAKEIAKQKAEQAKKLAIAKAQQLKQKAGSLFTNAKGFFGSKIETEIDYSSPYDHRIKVTKIVPEPIVSTPIKAEPIVSSPVVAEPIVNKSFGGYSSSIPVFSLTPEPIVTSKLNTDNEIQFGL